MSGDLNRPLLGRKPGQLLKHETSMVIGNYVPLTIS